MTRRGARRLVMRLPPDHDRRWAGAAVGVGDTVSRRTFRAGGTRPVAGSAAVCQQRAADDRRKVPKVPGRTASCMTGGQSRPRSAEHPGPARASGRHEGGTHLDPVPRAREGDLDAFDAARAPAHAGRLPPRGGRRRRVARAGPRAGGVPRGLAAAAAPPRPGPVRAVAAPDRREPGPVDAAPRALRARDPGHGLARGHDRRPARRDGRGRGPGRAWRRRSRRSPTTSARSSPSTTRRACRCARWPRRSTCRSGTAKSRLAARARGPPAIGPGSTSAAPRPA